MILQGKHQSYELLSLLSKGKYSWTYTGKSESNQTIFVKRFNANSGSAALFGFVQESQFSFDHPNLLGPSELIRKENALFQVRPFVEGLTLDKVLQDRKQRRRLKNEHIDAIFKDILNACGAMHREGVIHRDIKPANILLKDLESGVFRAILLDYGQAKIVGKADPRSCPFTMVYSSPEQVLKIGPLVNEDSDLFSLGVVMSELLSGKSPYSVNHPAALLNLQMSGELQNLSSISSKWQRIISKMCVKPDFPIPPNQMGSKELKERLRAAKGKRYSSVEELLNES